MIKSVPYEGKHVKLSPGDTLQDGDLYWSTIEEWVPVFFVGLVIQEGVDTEFVRPIEAND